MHEKSPSFQLLNGKLKNGDFILIKDYTYGFFILQFPFRALQ